MSASTQSIQGTGTENIISGALLSITHRKRNMLMVMQVCLCGHLPI